MSGKNSSKKNTEKEGQKPFKRNFMPVYVALFISICVITGYSYFTSPGYKKGRIMADSAITYETDQKGIKTEYRIECKNSSVKFSVKWSDPMNSGDWKKGKGSMEADEYFNLYTALENLANRLEQPGRFYNTLKIHKGSSSRVVPVNAADTQDREHKRMDTEFLTLAVKNVKETEYSKEANDPSMKILSNWIDPQSVLAVPEKMGFIQFNRIDGQLMTLRLRDNQVFPLGDDKLIASNYEGLGLVVEYGGSLIFWERKNLLNKRIVLDESVSSSPDDRDVLLSKDSVYFISNNLGDRKLKKYDYINRKTDVLKESFKGRLIDVSPDGSTLLTKTQQDGKTKWNLLETTSGNTQNMSLKESNKDKINLFGFFKNKDTFILSDSGKISIMKAGEKPSKIKLPKGEKHYPICLSPDNKLMITASLPPEEPETKTYSVINLEDNRVIQKIDNLKIAAPQFSPDEKSFFFFHLNDLVNRELSGLSKDESKPIQE